jgi:hypothetical protein
MNLRGKTILSLLALTLMASIALAAGCFKDNPSSANGNITPDYFPANFLCHSPIFSVDDDQVFFVGQWWE